MEKSEWQLVRQGKLEFVEMANKQKQYDQTSDPRTRKPKTRIEREENEDLEVDETSQATEGNPEIPENTGGQYRETDSVDITISGDEGGGGTRTCPGRT